MSKDKKKRKKKKYIKEIVITGERDKRLVGSWKSTENPDYVATFNADGTGTLKPDWGFGLTITWSTSEGGDITGYKGMFSPYRIFGLRFTWSTSGGNIIWNHSGQPRMYSPYRVKGNNWFVDGGSDEFHYIRLDN